MKAEIKLVIVMMVMILILQVFGIAVEVGKRIPSVACAKLIALLPDTDAGIQKAFYGYPGEIRQQTNVGDVLWITERDLLLIEYGQYTYMQALLECR